MGLEEFSRIVGLIQGGAVTVGAIGAVYTYRQAQALNRAKWVQELNHQFYDDALISETMRRIHHQWAAYRALLSARIADPSQPISGDDQRTMEATDRFLNYLEQVLYLLEARVLSRRDIQSNFRHWFNVLAGPNFPELTTYARTFGFVRLGRFLARGESFEAQNPITGVRRQYS